jgi:hypothetical protein
MAHRGSGGIALLILDLGARRGGWSALRSGHFTPEKHPVPIVQEAGWARGPVWTCAKNLAPTGIRSPERPARRQSLYRLSYRARMLTVHIHNKFYGTKTYGAFSYRHQTKNFSRQ